MTKRMLSLLLALVMTLSLCVPALAADEFAAEAVTEVEEQAPVDPVAEEVVADEPVAVAAAADEPVAAALTPSAGDLADLEAALIKADAISADVNAGKYVGTLYTLKMWEEESVDTQVRDFKTAYTAAKNLKASIDGGYWDGVTDPATVASELEARINNISNKLNLGNSNHQTITNRLAEIVYGYTAAATQPDDQIEFQPGYVADAKPIKEKADAANTSLLFADVIAVLEADADFCAKWMIPAVAGDLAPYVKPTLADAQRLQATIADAQALLKKELVDKGQKASAEVGKLQDYVTALEGTADPFDAMRDNGLKADVTLKLVNQHIAALKAMMAAVEEHKYGFEIVSYRVDSGYNNLYVYCEYPTGVNDNHDGYYVKAIRGTATATVKTWSPSTSATDNKSRWYVTIKAGDLLAGAANPTFTPNEQIKVELYNAKDVKVDEDTITIDGTYNGPKVVDQGIKGNDKLYIKLSDLIKDFTGYPSARIETTCPDGKVVKQDLPAADIMVYLNITSVQVGTYSVKLYVTEVGTPKNVENLRQTVEIKIDDITKYVNAAGNKVDKDNPYGTKGYDSLLKAIEGADGYEKLVTKTSSYTTAQAQQVVKNNLDAANKIVAAAATTPNTSAKRTDVDTALANLTKALALLTTAADQSDLDAAIAEAEALVEDDYTEATWGALDDAVTAGKGVKKTAISASADDAKAIAKAAKDIRDAIKALAPVKPDLTALKALVASVPARLAADDYTAESKAAVNAAVTAANAVLAKTGALKSEVKKATDDLQAALAALEVEAPAPQGPKAPVGGTGWSEYNGVWYYFVNNVMKKDYWVTNGSQHDLWYHMGSDGALDTGFQYIVDKTFGHGWYMLQATDSNGMLGAMLTGWQDTSIAGLGWFVPTHNGHYGECTWTKAWGDYNSAANTWQIGGTHITK